MKDNTNLKRGATRPADPKINEVVETIGEAAAEQAQLKLQAFPDGFIFKFTGHPKEPGKFVLFDTANRPIAITDSAPIADLLCQSVRMLFHAVELSKQEPPQIATQEQRGHAANSPVMES